MPVDEPEIYSLAKSLNILLECALDGGANFIISNDSSGGVDTQIPATYDIAEGAGPQKEVIREIYHQTPHCRLS
jgi:hypothetical protein